jgi:site-specific DNA-methyltransferase (adenine-specific)
MPSPVEGPGATVQWETPPELFKQLDEEFHFSLDGAASHTNALVARYCTAEGTFERPTLRSRKSIGPWDGLEFDWVGETAVFINPPYGPDMKPFLKRAAEWSNRRDMRSPVGGNINLGAVVMLLPVRTDRADFHEFIFKHADEIRFIKGRVKFLLDGKVPLVETKSGKLVEQGPTYPSMVVVYRPGRHRRKVSSMVLRKAA